MNIIRITKEFRYEGAHALLGYDGKCRHIHGHSYILYVTVTGSPTTQSGCAKDGMLIDFTDLKAVVNKNIIERFDHALVIRRDAPLAAELAAGYQNVEQVDFQPTCENLIIYFAEIIKANLPNNVKLHHLKLYETATSYVEWYAEDNK